MYKLILSIFGLLIGGGILLFTLRVPNATAENTVTVKGKVVNIYEAGVKDVVFKLEGDDISYYVNRGLENGLDINQLKKEYLNLDITLTYIEHNQLLHSLIDNRHLAKVEANNDVVYSEMP
ncbi:MAG: hypothetical protein ACE364_09445 [Chlorobiota bacterium]